LQLTSQSLNGSIVKLPVDAIYYISLQKAALRRHKLVQHLNSLDIRDRHNTPAMWHVANDGNRIKHRIDNSIKRAHKRPNMSLGEIGCFASHRELWQRQVDEGREFVLILEDDARFHVSKLRNLLLNWDAMPHFDFLHLGWEYYAGYKEQTIEKVEIDGLPDLYYGDGMWLTHAYILSLQGAQILLQRTEVQTNGLDAMTADIQSDMEAYGFRPAIAYQERFKTQIHHTG
jgi:GR25 family glycosyltransferase involved in LPS biosynthesis